jgi:phospholipid/cholesterol/gamma-HCH transport system substrate-binding protein
MGTVKPIFGKALLVGLLVAACGIAFLVAFTFFKKGGYSEKDSYVVHAFFGDATGLTWKSRVQIAGIQVGEVEKVTLEGSRARLQLRIARDIDIKVDACLIKQFPSALLPDAELEVSPGPHTSESLRDRPVEAREIRCVREGTSVAQLLDSLSKVTADIQVVTGDLAKTVGGSSGSIREVIENLSSISRNIDRTVNDNTDRFSAILENTESVTGNLREIAEKDRDRYHAIAKNVEEASAKLNKVLGDLDGMMGEGKPELDQSVQGVRQALDRLNASLENVKQVTDDLAQGKGVAGRLLTDERLGDKVASSIEGISSYVDRLTQLQIQMEFRSEWLLNQSGSKTYVGLKLLPRPDKFYLLEVVNDPRGVDTTRTETVVSGTVQNETTTTVHEDRLLFSLQLGKRYGPVTLRLGVIESSGGVGADLHLFDDHLQISTSVYQFTRPFNYLPHAKVWANIYFLQHLYVTAGADDFLNSWKAGHYPGGPRFAVGNDVFFGGGIYFTDDDIKTLLGSGAGTAVSAAKK